MLRLLYWTQRLTIQGPYRRSRDHRIHLTDLTKRHISSECCSLPPSPALSPSHSTCPSLPLPLPGDVVTDAGTGSTSAEVACTPSRSQTCEHSWASTSPMPAKSSLCNSAGVWYHGEPMACDIPGPVQFCTRLHLARMVPRHSLGAARTCMLDCVQSGPPIAVHPLRVRQLQSDERATNVGAWNRLPGAPEARCTHLSTRLVLPVVETCGSSVCQWLNE